MKLKPFVVYKDKRGKFRWRLTGSNGEIIGASSQGFTTRYRCKSNANLVRLILPALAVSVPARKL